MFPKSKRKRYKNRGQKDFFNNKLKEKYKSSSLWQRRVPEKKEYKNQREENCPPAPQHTKIFTVNEKSYRARNIIMELQNIQRLKKKFKKTLETPPQSLKKVTYKVTRIKKSIQQFNNKIGSGRKWNEASKTLRENNFQLWSSISIICEERLSDIFTHARSQKKRKNIHTLSQEATGRCVSSEERENQEGCHPSRSIKNCQHDSEGKFQVNSCA